MNTAIILKHFKTKEGISLQKPTKIYTKST